MVMDTGWRTILWHQFGASIDMLENAIVACPEGLWSDRSGRPEFWYVAYHTLFLLDLYLSESPDGFEPPAPFTLEELDDILPEQPYRKDELLSYLEHGREKCRSVIGSLTDEELHAVHRWWTRDASRLEMLIYNMRHVQHHAAQLNLILRQQTDSAPAWVARTTRALDPGR
jgi:DinB superfamily